MRVIGIETPATRRPWRFSTPARGLLSHRLHSQIALHQAYGGVVPELASRDHVSGSCRWCARRYRRRNPSRETIDGVAYTAGPGLIGALLVGAGFARSLAYAWGKPAIGIHHLEGHLLAPLLEPEPPSSPSSRCWSPGGHTQLVDVAGRRASIAFSGRPSTMRRGRLSTRRPRCSGLPYPGGAALAHLAESGRAGRFNFPRPMLDRPGLEFSFSGLKTAALAALRGRVLDEQIRADVARGFQEAVVDTLAEKARRALAGGGYRRLVVAGGVGANPRLRERLGAIARNAGATAVFPAGRVLHRQRRDDRARRRIAFGGGAASGPRGRRPGELGARGGTVEIDGATDSRVQWTRYSFMRSKPRRSSASTTGSARSVRPSSSTSR